MTGSEREYEDLVRSLGCIVCRRLGHGPTPAEFHHLREGAGASQKNSNTVGIPLCHAHHRTGGPGVALHAGQQTWESLYGTEMQLLGLTILDAFLAAKAMF